MYITGVTLQFYIAKCYMLHVTSAKKLHKIGGSGTASNFVE